ncbi:RNase H domain-containing protein [Trichonephila clavipes]|nr:RNase H domain-containing protein [Trichonephila clavipes]
MSDPVKSYNGLHPFPSEFAAYKKNLFEGLSSFLTESTSFRDWGVDAGTLRVTYVSLICPILKYGFPMFCCSSESNLLKLERVQLSAARIITGLRNSCPKDFVLYEADLQPLSLRRNACLVKYYSKLSSLGFLNRTSKFLRSWSSHQRLKRDSHFEHVVSGHLVASSI